MFADLVLLGNRIFDGTGSQPFSGGIAVVGNKIARVADRGTIKEFIGPETKVMDYDDELIMPGFHDGHMHYFIGALAASSYVLDLSTAKTAEECAEMAGAYAKENPEKNYVYGIGWFSHDWINDTVPTKELLDRYVADRPVVLCCSDLHTYWLNSKALEMCGYTKESAFSVGELEKNNNGDLTGLVLEIEAGAKILDMMMSSYSPQEKEQMQLDFQKKLVACGITSTCDMACELTALKEKDNYRVAYDIADAGKAMVRLFIYPSLGNTGDFSEVKKLREQYNSPFVRISGLKQFVDGVTTTWTGWLLEPYLDAPDTCGAPFLPKELFRELILKANKEGFRVRLHTLGDAAIRMALDIFEQSKAVNPQFTQSNTVEHVEALHPDDLPRFLKTGTIASMQPEHLILERMEKLDRIGLERCRYEWPFKSLEKAGATLAFGTDYPVVDFKPFSSIYASVARLFPEGGAASVNQDEVLSMAETLKAYTYGSACANAVENEVGTLKEGMLADIIVLDRDLFNIPHNEIKSTEVLVTISDGRIVYTAFD